MPAEAVAESPLTIRPLTFAQIMQSADEWKTHRVTADVGGMPLRTLGLPVAYHLATSAFGAYDGDDVVGWMFLRGWYQVLFVEALSVAPGPHNNAACTALLTFAEEQARTLKRRWLALPASGEDAATLSFFEELGFSRGHWRVLRRKTPPPARRAGADVELRPLAGPAAEAAFREYAMADVTAGDAESSEEFLSRFLSDDPYHSGTRAWLARFGGAPLAYLSQNTGHIYVAARPQYWGQAAVRDAVERVAQMAKTPAAALVVRLASAGHHDAARPAFEEAGFAEHPARLVRMIKHLDRTS